MSERTAIEYARLNRRRRLGRRALGRKQKIAVSPVVATLILILVAVAAAAALYLWLNGWQTGITHSIGNPGPQASVTIGGSTSVYPFEFAAVQQFEQNNSGIAISANQGGTGAGMLAVCTGQVDIGAASTYETVAGLQTSDNCPVTTVITTIAWDAVDIIVPTANTHGLVSMSFDTLTSVYDGATVATGAPAATLLSASINGQLLTAVPYAEAPFNAHAALSWDQIPAAINGATVAGCPITTETVSSVAATGLTVQTGAACAAPNANDWYTVSTTASSCGYNICAGGATGANAIKTVARSDASGTTQTFTARLLGATSSSGFASSVSGLGFGGCGSNNIIADCGMVSTQTGNGNPGVISAVAAGPDTLGYASDGLVRATGSGVSFIGFAGPGQTTAVVPSLGATGTISIGAQLEEGKAVTLASVYAGVRPFQWVTENTPTGEVEQLITWVMDPANNINVAADTAEVSVYSI